MTHRSKYHHAITAIKLVVLAATVVWIFVQSKEDWQSFATQEKDWWLLGGAFLLVLTAHLISYWRWKGLVNALHVPMDLMTGVRLGFLGTLFNQVSVGSVGGDLFKAIEAAQNAPGRKTEVVASVLVDRAVGLLGLLIVASGGLMWATSLSPRLVAIKWIAISLSLIGLGAVCTIGILGKQIPIHWFRKLPAGGHLLERLAKACMVFQGNPRLIFSLIVSSILVHTAFTLACFLISMALFTDIPTVSEHFSTIPPAMAAATLPITPGGVGVQEMAISRLFKELPHLPESYSAVIMATTFRMLLIAVCFIGALYYFAGVGAKKSSPRVPQNELR